MRILIYGAGVIGSLYAALFSKAGYEVSVYARGRWLQELNAKGLLRVDGVFEGVPQGVCTLHPDRKVNIIIQTALQWFDLGCADFLMAL